MSMDAPVRPKLAEGFIDPSVRLREAVIGRRCEILRNSRVEYARLGDYSYLGEHCDVADAEIGKFTAIANCVRIGAPNHPMQRASQHRFSYVPEYYEENVARDASFFAQRRAARVRVGHDVWIGHAAILLPGIVVGDGAVIAAGAVVSRDVAPYSIVGGVPARRIRERFPRHVAKAMARIAWWDWPEQKIFAHLRDFQHEDIEEFCALHDPEWLAQP
jgi:phosphonate metabolism protein (transferase hexapeptide repeat family)